MEGHIFSRKALEHFGNLIFRPSGRAAFLERLHRGFARIHRARAHGFIQFVHRSSRDALPGRA
jgi:hypothetical protein